MPLLFIPRNIWHHLRAKGALETEAQLPGTEAGSKYYDLCRGALADARTTFAWLDQQLAASAEVRVYHGPGISPPEVRKMEEIEQSGAQAKLDVQTLAERCEREHSEARGDDKVTLQKSFLPSLNGAPYLQQKLKETSFSDRLRVSQASPDRQ